VEQRLRGQPSETVGGTGDEDACHVQRSIMRWVVSGYRSPCACSWAWSIWCSSSGAASWCRGSGRSTASAEQPPFLVNAEKVLLAERDQNLPLVVPTATCWM